MSILFAVVLVSQGVVQTFADYRSVSLLQATKDADGHDVVSQMLALGPAASQIAIKDLGTNGGGFFNANSAHPFRESDTIIQLSYFGVALAHSGRSDAHVWEDGSRHAAGVGTPRGHARDLHSAHLALRSQRTGRQSRACILAGRLDW